MIGRFIYLFRWIIVSYVLFSSFKFILSQFFQRKKNTPETLKSVRYNNNNNLLKPRAQTYEEQYVKIKFQISN